FIDTSETRRRCEIATLGTDGKVCRISPLEAGDGNGSMKLRLSLSWKIALLAVLTLVMLTGVLLIFAGVQFRISLTNFIVAPAVNRILSVSGELAQDLAETPASSHSELLSRLSKEYGVDSYLVDFNGRSLTNTPVNLPDSIREQISQSVQRLRPGPGRL